MATETFASKQLTAEEREILRDAIRRELSLAEAFRGRVQRQGKREARERCEAVNELLEKIQQAVEIHLLFE
ncbi:MAG: hypothetical protein J5I94_03865 [Phaeodactylibacter sp.]|nr:hypothetical protein [Phaeodactylibacter sp.]